MITRIPPLLQDRRGPNATGRAVNGQSGLIIALLFLFVLIGAGCTTESKIMNEAVDVFRLHPYTKEVFGWFQQFPWIGILFALMFLDVFSGFIAAFRTKTVDSSVSGQGMAKKGGIWIMILLVALLNKASPQIPAVQVVAFYYILHEALSTMENLGKAGVPLPPFLSDALKKLQDFKEVQKSAQPLVIEREKHTIEKHTLVEKPKPGVQLIDAVESQVTETVRRDNSVSTTITNDPPLTEGEPNERIP